MDVHVFDIPIGSLTLVFHSRYKNTKKSWYSMLMSGLLIFDNVPSIKKVAEGNLGKSLISHLSAGLLRYFS